MRSLRARADPILAYFLGRDLGGDQDMLLAAFNGPTRAAQCALALCEAVKAIGLRIRVGLHAGELETSDEAPEGMALHVVACIARVARPGEVIASGTLHDLMAGEPPWYRECGACALDGLGEPVRLFAVSDRSETVLRGFVAEPRLALTQRERDVLNLIAHGGTNPEIARALRLSGHTVKRHVANILFKLELPNRSAAAAFAARHGGN
jgi:DNA-binding CsgD family transcriptional regulator